VHGLARRQRITPGPLSILVDGVDLVGTISSSESERFIDLGKEANMIQIVGEMRRERSPLARHILNRGDESKPEVWTVELPWGEEILCTFKYDQERRVRAEFKLTESAAARLANPFDAVRILNLCCFRLKKMKVFMAF